MKEGLTPPQVERFVGKSTLSPEEALKIYGSTPTDGSGKVITDMREILRIVFETKASQHIKDLEMEKTEKDLQTLELVKSAIRSFAEGLGKKEFVDIPNSNIHFLKNGETQKLTKGMLGAGSHSTIRGEIFVDRRDDLGTAITTFHELWHMMASHQAIQLTTNEEVDWYRSGFSINSRDGSESWFDRIDEGLVGIMTKRFVEEVLAKNSDFESLLKQKRNIDTTRKGEAELVRISAKEIYDKNKEGFSSEEEVVEMFLRAQVTGNILPVARIIEDSFGKGSFRKFGEFTEK